MYLKLFYWVLIELVVISARKILLSSESTTTLSVNYMCHVSTKQLSSAFLLLQGKILGKGLHSQFEYCCRARMCFHENLFPGGFSSVCIVVFS